MEEKTSEFGKGFTYCLFLFAKHWWRHYKDLEVYNAIRNKADGITDDMFSERRAISMWFNGASDHLFELEVPPKYQGTEIGELTERLKDKGIEYRLSFRDNEPSLKDFDKFFEDMEKLMRLIDQDLGVETIEAEWK